MGGFQPMFGGAPPREESSSTGASSGFTSMFGSAPTGSTPEPSGDTEGSFTPLFQTITQSAEVPPKPIDLDLVQEAAREEGRQEVRAELQAELDAMQAKLDALEPAFDQLVVLRTEALRQAASDVGSVVLEACRRVLSESLVLHPDALRGVLHRAIDQLPDGDDIRIRVRPDDVSRARDAVGDRYEDCVEADPDIDAGCRVEARHASVDATLDAALEGIDAAVTQWLDLQG